LTVNTFAVIQFETYMVYTSERSIKGTSGPFGEQLLLL